MYYKMYASLGISSLVLLVKVNEFDSTCDRISLHLRLNFFASATEFLCICDRTNQLQKIQFVHIFFIFQLIFTFIIRIFSWFSIISCMNLYVFLFCEKLYIFGLYIFKIICTLKNNHNIFFCFGLCFCWIKHQF